MFLFFILGKLGPTSEWVSYCDAQESRELTSTCSAHVRSTAPYKSGSPHLDYSKNPATLHLEKELPIDPSLLIVPADDS